MTDASAEVKELMKALVKDPLRKHCDFSNDMRKVHRVLWSPFPDAKDQVRMLRRWLQRFQPCIFGQVAAAQDTMHVCILEDSDLYSSDVEIAARIREDVLNWKRRSLSPVQDHSYPAHGFLLLVASPRIANAEPNAALHALAGRIRALWGVPMETHQVSGEVYWESLYLRDPKTAEYFKFTFSVDFFAAQGDGRWWQDHRIPGGLAFTANSVGHMKRYRELYENKKDQTEWILKTAMLTIAGAQGTESGPATWLLSAGDAGPMIPGISCPVDTREFKTGRLAAKDWYPFTGRLA